MSVNLSKFKKHKLYNENFGKDAEDVEETSTKKTNTSSTSSTSITSTWQKVKAKAINNMLNISTDDDNDDDTTINADDSAVDKIKKAIKSATKVETNYSTGYLANRSYGSSSKYLANKALSSNSSNETETEETTDIGNIRNNKLADTSSNSTVKNVVNRLSYDSFSSAVKEQVGNLEDSNEKLKAVAQLSNNNKTDFAVQSNQIKLENAEKQAEKNNEKFENSGVLGKASIIAGNAVKGGVTGLAEAVADPVISLTNFADNVSQSLGGTTKDRNKQETGLSTAKLYQMAKDEQSTYGANLNTANSLAYSLGQQVGYMAPGMLVGGLAGAGVGLEETSTILTKLPTIMEGLQVGGSTYIENLNDDESNYLQSALKGALYGTATYFIEGLTGGNILAKNGSLDDTAKKLIAENIKSSALQKLASKGYEITGEVLEENTENLVDGLIDVAMGEKTIKECITEFKSQIKDTTIQTALLTTILNAFGLGGDTYNGVQELNSTDYIIDNANLSDVEKTTLKELVQEKNLTGEEVQNLIANHKSTYTESDKQEVVKNIAQDETASDLIDNSSIEAKEKESLKNVAEKYNLSENQVQELIDNTINGKYNNQAENQSFTESARENNIDTNSEEFQTISKILDNRNLQGEFKSFDSDKSAYYENGNVVFNANASTDKTLYDLTIHETTHSLLENNQNLKTKVLNEIKKSGQYEEFYNEIASLYSEEYKNSANFESDIQEEMVADYLGKNLSTEEFITKLSEAKQTQNKSKIRQVIDNFIQKIKDLFSIKFGLDRKATFWKNIENQFYDTYLNSDIVESGDTKYFIESIANFDENEYNKTKQVLLPTQEYAVLSSIVNSDSNIKPGINKVETTNATYTVYFKETGEFKVIDKYVEGNTDDGNSERTVSGTDESRNGRGIQYTNSETTFQKEGTISSNDEVSNIDTRGTSEVAGSVVNGSRDSGNNIKYSKENSEKGSFLNSEDFNNYILPEIEEHYKNESKNKITETLEELRQQKENLDTSTDEGWDKNFEINQKIRALENGFDNVYDNYINEEINRLKKDDIKNLEEKVKNRKRQEEKQNKLQKEIKEASPLKKAQYEKIQETNPMFDDEHVGIRSPADIKTFEETINDDESFSWGDYSKEDALRDLERGQVTVYSSNPIKNGTFVSTSKIQAQEYAGGEGSKVYSKTIKLNRVAWINGDEGQYANVGNLSNEYEINKIKETDSISGTSLNRPSVSSINNSITSTNGDVNTNIKYSMQNSENNTDNQGNKTSAWQKFLEETSRNKEKGKTIKDLKLPQAEKVQLPVAENKNIEYNDVEGEVDENEFRRIQEESRRQSNNGIEEQRISTTNNEGLQRRLSTVFKRELERRGINSSTNKLLRLNSNKGNTFNVYENVDAETFHDIFEITKSYTDNGELVTLHDIEDYKSTKNYLSDDGLSGFAITKEGDLISVFNANSKKGFLYSIADIVKQNAKTLDCYASENQNLKEIYEKVFDFKTASIMDYNMEYDHDNIAENHNTPQVAFMVNTEQEVQTLHFDKDSYDEAVEYRNNYLEELDDSSILLPQKKQVKLPQAEDSFDTLINDFKAETEKLNNGTLNVEETKTSSSDFDTKSQIVSKRTKKKTPVSQLLDSFYQAVVNKNHYIDKLAKETGNEKLKYKANRLLGTANEAQHSIGIEQISIDGNVVGDSLLSIREEVRKAGRKSKEVGENDFTVEDFEDYLLNKHNTARDIVEKGIYGDNFTAKQSSEKVAYYEEKFPEFKEYAEKIYKYNQNNLQDLVDSGMVSKVTRGKIKINVWLLCANI